MLPEETGEINETIIGHVIPPSGSLFRAGFMFTLGTLVALMAVSAVLGIVLGIVLAIANAAAGNS
jgi:hypothetical protein